MGKQTKFYKVIGYTSKNASKQAEKLIRARNLSEAREIAQTKGFIYIQSAYTFEYFDR